MNPRVTALVLGMAIASLPARAGEPTPLMPARPPTPEVPEAAAGRPTPLVPAPAEVPAAGPDAALPPVEVAPTEPDPESKAGFAERAGRAIDRSLQDTGEYLDRAATTTGHALSDVGDAATDAADSAARAAGSAWDWIVRETGELVEDGGKAIESLGE